MSEHRERLAALLWAVVALALLALHVSVTTKGKRR